MTGLEIPGFVVGLSGIIPIVEKSFAIWKSLAEAKEFGEEMMRIVAHLTFEYHRFLTWARVSGIMQYQDKAPEGPFKKAPQPPDIESFQSAAEFLNQIEHPVEKAASRIVSLLDEIHKIAEKYKLEGNTASHDENNKADSGSIVKALSMTLPLVGLRHNLTIHNLKSKHEASAATVQGQTSFKLRFLFSSKPWGKTDKQILDQKVTEMATWNDRLESMLPNHLRDSFAQALSGHLLIDENKDQLDTLTRAAEHQNEPLRAHAILWQEKLDFQYTSKTLSRQSKNYRREKKDLKSIPQIEQSHCEAALTAYQEDNQPPMRMMIEWYSFKNLNWSVADLRTAISRLEEIIHLSNSKARPSSLRIMTGFGFIETEDSFGLISHLPPSANVQRQPVSLYSILRKDPEVVRHLRPPSLEQRLSLAQQLCAAVYSLSLARWLHKDINSHNILFFRGSTADSGINLQDPYIAGFSVSRPEGKNEKSLNKDMEARAIYLHPDLRLATLTSRPQYHCKYEMYSLGLLMFEIGIWTTIDRAVKHIENMEAEQLTTKIKAQCARDLPFFTGERYCDIVLRCLAAADATTPESDTSLDAFYWTIVMETAKCQR